MSSSFRHLKRGECGICNGSRKDCRQSTQTGLTHCRHDVASVPGFRFIGQDALGFNMWAVDDGIDTWSQEEREQRRQEVEVRRRQRENEERDRREKLLSIEERDRQYRLVNQNLRLIPRHQKTLHEERKLTAPEIDLAVELGAIRTWNPGQRINGASPDLAGIDPLTGSLAGVYGLAIYSFDPDRHITGAQVKPDNKEFGKYIWVSSQSKGGNGPHLPNGELPLFVWKDPNATTINEVWLCEGALKSLIVALKLSREGKTDIAVIGTASAARYGEKTLKEYLERLSCKTLRLMPDGGAVGNAAIRQANQQTLESCQRWGYSISVGWWDQFDKSDPDIDEVGDFSAIAYLSPEDFLGEQKIHPENIDFGKSRVISGDEWQTKFGIPEWLKHQIGRFKDLFGKSVRLKSRPIPSPKAEPTLSKILRYIPKTLPSLAGYQALGNPIIRFAAGQRLQLIEELAEREYQHILDTSHTGSSKSHEAGLADPKRLGLDRLWYFSESHRNPTVATVEANYTDMPVRNNGMVTDGSRRTALNNPHVRWPKKGEVPSLPGNCFRTEIFHTLAGKNYSIVNEEAKINPVCGSCHAAGCCAGAEGATPQPGASYRSERRDVFEFADRVRASVNSSPNGEDLAKDKNGAFWDEVMQQLKPVSQVEASLPDFDQVFAELESKLPDVHDQLKPLRLALRPILAGSVTVTQKTYHGWGDATLRDILGSVPHNLEEIICQLESIQPNFAEFLEEPDSFTKEGVDKKDRKNFSKAQSKRVRDAVRQNSYREINYKLQALATNWLIPLLKVWGELERGAIRARNKTLVITTRTPRHAEIANAMQLNIYLDTTARLGKLALYLDIKPEDIVQIQQEPADYSNLTIVRVTGFGVAGHARSDSFKKRKQALKAGISIRYSGKKNAFLDHKEHAADDDGWLFNHNRGSNEFLDCDTLTVFGTPFENIGGLQDLYTAYSM